MANPQWRRSVRAAPIRSCRAIRQAHGGQIPLRRHSGRALKQIVYGERDLSWKSAIVKRLPINALKAGDGGVRKSCQPTCSTIRVGKAVFDGLARIQVEVAVRVLPDSLNGWLAGSGCQNGVHLLAELFHFLSLDMNIHRRTPRMVPIMRRLVNKGPASGGRGRRFPLGGASAKENRTHAGGHQAHPRPHGISLVISFMVSKTAIPAVMEPPGLFEVRG